MYKVRAVSLSNFVEIAREVGIDPYEAFRRAGITQAMLERPENRIPAKLAIDLFEFASARSGCESFGLRMAENRSAATLGPLSLLLERVATVRDTVQVLIDYQQHINNILTIAWEDRAGIPCIRFEMVPECLQPQVVDHSVALAFQAVRWASGGQWGPLSVHLTRKAPADLSVFQRFYPCPVNFSSTFNGLRCTEASLDIGNPLADATMAQHMRQLLGLVELEEGDEAIGEQVKRAIALLLPNGQATVANVALHLGMSVRTLQRVLDGEGQSFATLLNGMRRELTKRYLLGGDHSVAMVAELIGYSSASSFNRWFNAEFGCAPQKWRADATGR